MSTSAASDPSGNHSADDDEIVLWWRLVERGYETTQREFMNELAQRFNLASSLVDIIVRLLHVPEHRMRMTQMAREATLSSGGFTKMADRLSAAGLIRRVNCEADRRMIYVELTDEGYDVATKIRAAAVEILRRRVLPPLGREGFQHLAETMNTLHKANIDES